MQDLSPPRDRRSLGRIARFALRAVIVYFVLYCHPFPLSLAPDYRGINQLWHWQSQDGEPLEPLEVWGPIDRFYELRGRYMSGYSERQNKAVDEVAEGVLGFEHQLDRPFGSGDPTFSYVLMATRATVAVLVAGLWGLVVLVLRRRDRFLPWLLPWIHLGGRYYLGSFMLSYGAAKVFPSQFRFPMLGRLETPYGDGSPMNILWSFMGSSTAYTVFAGLMEFIPGLLLLFRRTALLGALLTAGVMANVAMLNYCYDVPVKLFSTHLMVVALALTIPDLRRVVAVLLHRPAPPPRDLTRPVTGIPGHLVRLVVLVPLIGYAVDRIAEGYHAPKNLPQHYGVWDVEHFAVDGTEVAPRLDDPLQFQALIVERETFGWLKTMSGPLRSLGLAHDEDEDRLTLSTNSTWHYTLDGDELELLGEHSRTFRAAPFDRSQPGEPRDPQQRLRLVRDEAFAPEAVDPSEEPAGPAEPGPSSDDEVAAEAEPEIPASLVGRWVVTEHETIGDVATRRRPTPFGWTAVTIDAKGGAVVEYPLRSVAFDLDARPADEAGAGTLSIRSAASLAITREGDDSLVLEGEFRGADVRVEMTRRPLDSFLLVRRGYHWINEIPLNRY